MDLLDQIGHAGEAVIRKPRRRGVVHPLPSELRAGIALLRELQLIRSRLECLCPEPSKRLSAMSTSSDDIADTLREARNIFRQVLQTIAGAAR